MNVFMKALLLLASILVYFPGEVENDDWEIRWLFYGQPGTITHNKSVSKDQKLRSIEWFHSFESINNTVYKWENDKSSQGPSYKHLFDFSAMKPEITSNGATARLFFKNVTFERVGKYFVQFLIVGPKTEKTIYLQGFDVKVFALQTPNLTASICPGGGHSKDQRVGLQCEAKDIYPKPEIEFFVFNTSNKVSTKLDGEVYIKFTQKSNSISYDIKAKMFVPDSLFPRLADYQAGCEVKVLLDKLNLSSYVSNTTQATLNSDGSNRSECLQNLRMEKHEHWHAVGEGPVLFRCTFDIPHMDYIRSVYWLHHNYSESQPFYKWDEQLARVTAETKYSDEMSDMTLIMPWHIKGRMATTLMFRKATPELAGNYSCRVNFGKVSSQSITSLLVVYQLLEPFYFNATRCRGNKTIGLYCNLTIAYRKPLEMAFHLLHPYKPQRPLNHSIYITIRENDGLYNIRGKMIVPIVDFKHPREQAKCVVIFHRDPLINETRMRYLADAARTDNRECTPPLQIIDKREVWQENGTGPVVFRCRIDIPYNVTIKTIQWIHENHEPPLYQWNSTTNKLQYNQNYEDLIPIFPNVLDDRIIVTLEFKRATLKHSGKYMCQAIFDKRENQSDTANLNVYELPKEYTMKATRCPDKKTIGLSCNVTNLIHKPLDMLFYVYNPDSKRQHLLNYPIYFKMEDEKNNVYGMSGEMIVPIDRFLEVHPMAKFKCEVTLLRDPLVRGSKTKKVTSLQDPQNSDECVPHLKIEKHDVWYKEGSQPTLNCTFDVPFNDSVVSIEWFHQNFSMQKPFYKWINKTGRIDKDPEYGKDRNNWVLIKPRPQNGVNRKITTMKFDAAKLKHFGNYTCRVTFGLNAHSELATTLLVIYRVDEPYQFSRRGCSDKSSEFVCKAKHVFPAPIAIEFSVGSATPKTLDNPRVEIKKVNETYNVTAKIILPSQDQIDKIMCSVVLNREPKVKNETSLEASEMKGEKCDPRVEIKENNTRWESAGSRPLSILCGFRIPEGDKAESIEWFHHEFSTHKPIYKWNKDGTEERGSGYNTTGGSPKAVQGSADSEQRISNLTFVETSLEYSGRYSCKVTFKDAGKHDSNTTNLIVYQLNKPNFTAIGCRDQVRLRCMAEKVSHEPKDIEFSILGQSNKLNGTKDVDIKKENELYDITATMIISFSVKPGEGNPNFKCDIVLSRNFSISNSATAERRNSTPDSVGGDGCSPKVEIGLLTQWAKVDGDLALQCKYEHPPDDQILFIDWFKWNDTAPDILMEVQEDDDLDKYPLPEESQMILKFKKVKLSNAGNYSCQVNYQLAGNRSNSSILIVYQLQLPIYFIAKRSSESNLIELECKAQNAFPKPEAIVLSEYNPITKVKSTFTENHPLSVKEAHGVFSVSTNLSIKTNKSKDVEYVCDVVFSKKDGVMETTSTSMALSLLLSNDTSAKTGGGSNGNDEMANVAIISSGAVASLILWLFWSN